MESNKSMVDGELYQEGCARVQYFSSPALPVLPGTILEPRRGRPIRSSSEQQQTAVPPETVEQLKSQVSTLSAAERAELAYFLLTSLESEEQRAAWRKEIARRVAEIPSGQAVGRSIEEVLVELRERYP